MVKLGIALPESVPLPGTTTNLVDAVKEFSEKVARKGSGPLAPVYYPTYVPVWCNAQDEEFPDSDTLNALLDMKIRPIIFFETSRGSSLFQNQRWANGKHNAYLKEFGRRLTLVGRRILVRVDQEFNGTFFPWTIGKHNNTAENFISMWRTIVWQIRSVAGDFADKIQFIWCPQGALGPNTIDIRWFYPGPSWVDYFGFDRYESSGDGLPSINLAYRKIYYELRDIDPTQRIIVCETGIQRQEEDGVPTNNTIRYNWWRQVKRIDVDYPNIVGVNYFNMDLVNINHLWAQNGQMFKTDYNLFKSAARLSLGR